ncbi:hypothetical protein WICPIJ_006328 [Wickerhamomyces pijperi]|uniref:3-hydroxy-3-methylglutaryl coenzyme A reductase n=1 Tax=Wickerhamomyces pijperi TaxID=599730 RepID=A0A9P8TL45_WICPI|nr:hypothetical protein WICPIJ_006328 [Wickerhamomyces pijperi]
MPVSNINKPFRAVATLLAYVAKVSSFHPIHTLIVTCLLASIAYLSIVDQYFSLSSSTAEVVSGSSVSSSTQSSYSPSDLSYYYISPRTKEWVKVSDLTKITSEIEHYNVFPYQFGRGEDVTFPALENSLSDSSDSSVKFVITKNFQDEPVQSALIANDGTVWEYKTYHTKLSKYTESVMNVYHKLVSLLQGAETFDIAIIALAYAGMGYTFISLFLDMKKIGSKFWLGFATLVTSFFAFLFGLYTATRFLNIDVPVLSLTEGVPFLVATIGFKHKILLTQKVLHKYSSKEYLKNGSSDVLFYGIKDQGTYLVRDYALIITAFVGCSIYASYLENLRNFCLLGALMVAFDLIVTTVFYSAILALKLEINLISRAIVLKQTLQEDGLTESTIDEVIRSNSLTKDNALPDNGDGAVLTTFKIVAISGFFAFHAFGLGSAWLSDIEVAGSVASLLDKSILSQIPVGGKGTLVTLFPTKFFLPLKTSIQIEDFILSAFGYVSAAIRDRYISKFVLFLFTVSVSINIYLLNAARIHSKAVEKDVIEFKKPKKIRSEPTVSSTSLVSLSASSDSEPEHDIRPFDQLVEIATNGDIKSLFNDEVALLAAKGKVPLYALEKKLGDNTRAVAVRRQAIAIIADVPHLNTHKLPYLNYDYDRVFGACCENVIGYMPLPVGVAGPLIIDGKPYHIPMATTEGCLVASAMRGCKAINLGGGTTTVLTKDGMTRGPVVSFPSLKRAGACKIWVDSEEGQATIKKAFNSTSRFARLQHIQTALAGDLLFLRFRTTTGDAMGMNMISKGVEFSLNQMVTEFGWDDMSIISVSGNYCTDKKPAAINWIEGRGKSIVAEAIIPKSAVEKVLKTTVKLLVKVNINKNLIGSAMAGSVGGFNAQAANLLTAIYLACGQDPAQNVESSNCITLLDETEDGDLKISVSMPSIEVGTIGGGTILDPQGSMLELLGVKGPATVPGDNARQFAKIVASLVLAGELSLLSALAAGHLVQSHMQHNRAGAGKK